MGLNLKWVIGWFLNMGIKRIEKTRGILQRSLIIGSILKIGGGFNLYGSKGPSGPGVEELREAIRERQKRQKISDIEVDTLRVNIKEQIRKRQEQIGKDWKKESNKGNFWEDVRDKQRVKKKEERET